MAHFAVEIVQTCHPDLHLLFLGCMACCNILCVLQGSDKRVQWNGTDLYFVLWMEGSKTQGSQQRACFNTTLHRTVTCLLAAAYNYEGMLTLHYFSISVDAGEPVVQRYFPLWVLTVCAGLTVWDLVAARG